MIKEIVLSCSHLPVSENLINRIAQSDGYRAKDIYSNVRQERDGSIDSCYYTTLAPLAKQNVEFLTVSEEVCVE